MGGYIHRSEMLLGQEIRLILLFVGGGGLPYPPTKVYSYPPSREDY